MTDEQLAFIETYLHWIAAHLDKGDQVSARSFCDLSVFKNAYAKANGLEPEPVADANWAVTYPATEETTQEEPEQDEPHSDESEQSEDNPDTME